jgi:hypothetical protein
MELFKCSVCNYEVIGDKAPEVCPKCGAKHEQFVQMEKDVQDKVEKASRTNTLLASLVAIADELAVIAKEGKEINLDPGCLRTFTYAAEQAEIIKAFAKAEIETHIKKSKW